MGLKKHSWEDWKYPNVPRFLKVFEPNLWPRDAFRMRSLESVPEPQYTLLSLLLSAAKACFSNVSILNCFRHSVRVTDHMLVNFFC